MRRRLTVSWSATVAHSRCCCHSQLSLLKSTFSAEALVSARHRACAAACNATHLPASMLWEVIDLQLSDELRLLLLLRLGHLRHNAPRQQLLHHLAGSQCSQGPLSTTRQTSLRGTETLFDVQTADHIGKMSATGEQYRPK